MLDRAGRAAHPVPQVIAMLALAVLVAGCGGSAGGRAPRPSAVGAHDLTPAAVSGVPAFHHVFVIVLENTEYDTIVRQPSAAPYLQSLIARGALQTAYTAVAHPSLPNYLALVSGGTHGIASDCARCFIDAPNLGDQVEAAGRTWRAYLEGMPGPCTLGDAGSYVQHHNPWVYFDDIRNDRPRCDAHVVPLAQLDVDLAAGAVPNLVWITPDVCHDMHDCSVATGDAWLRDFLPRILESAAFRDHGVLFITFDEGTTAAGGGGRVFTLALGPDVRAGYRSPVPETHYSLLRTIEDAWDLPPLGHAADATSMASSFRP